MEEVISAANAANSATLTMKYFFFSTLVVKKITNGAEITGEFYTAFLAVLLGWLDSFTLHTLDLFDVMSINLVILFWVHFLIKFLLIVTKSTNEKFFTLWALELAFSDVMLAARKVFSSFEFC